MRRRTFCAVAGLGLGLHAVGAEPYPTRPVRMICPYAAGGGPDILARRLASPLGDVLGQSVFVENKVGAAGVLGAQFVAGQPPDGYTLLQGAISAITQKLITPSLKFDPLQDFTPICNMASAPNVLMVRSDSPYTSLDDLFAAARREPGKLNFGSGGIGSAAHLAGATMAMLAGIEVVHIPLKGSVEIAASLLRGDTQFAFPITGTALPHIKGGKFRALAVTSGQRLAQLPDVPT